MITASAEPLRIQVCDCRARTSYWVTFEGSAEAADANAVAYMARRNQGFGSVGRYAFDLDLAAIDSVALFSAYFPRALAVIFEDA